MYTFYFTILLVLILIFSSIRKQDKDVLLEKDSTIFIRGIATIFIVLHHTVQHTNANNGIVWYFRLIGYICVAIFFLLSGYGNTFSYRNNKSTKIGWLLKRILRICITFWFIWIIDLIAILFINEDKFSIIILIKQALTLTLPYWINWYLKIQVIFYIAYKLFKKNNDIVLLLLTIISVCIMYILRLESFWWNTMICFGLGSVFAERKEKIIINLKKNKYIKLILSLVAFVLLFILGTRSFELQVISSIAFCIFITILLFVFKFKSKIINFIGNLSLEIYLWHGVLLKLLFKDSKNIINLNINLLLFFILSILLAFITNKIVNKIIKS